MILFNVEQRLTENVKSTSTKWQREIRLKRQKTQLLLDALNSKEIIRIIRRREIKFHNVDDLVKINGKTSERSAVVIRRMIRGGDVEDEVLWILRNIFFSDTYPSMYFLSYICTSILISICIWRTCRKLSISWISSSYLNLLENLCRALSFRNRTSRDLRDISSLIVFPRLSEDRRLRNERSVGNGRIFVI